ncbi:hypothetical protein M0R45_020339 [Rubus argutus]|uniref:AIPP2-like SPOC-like domain-containing protein n=1 Tax=Rubus argutus TaxID=59490 RepID=A0AAW1XAE7_RUBAR
MRFNPSLVEDWDPHNWVCESCEQGNGMLSQKSSIKEDTLESSAVRGHYDRRHSAGPSRNCKDSGWQAHSKRQKPVVNGKVRFITNEEVRRLSLADMPQKTAFGYKIGTPKSPVSRVKANPSIIRSEIAMPRRHDRPPKMQSISKLNQQACQNLKHSQEKRAPGTPTKGHIIFEQPMDALVLSQRVETSTRMTVEQPNKFSCTPSTSRHSSLNMSYGGNTSATEHNHSDDEERDLLNMFPSLHLYRSSLPALHATWKGGFIIFDAETPAEFVGGFQARAPCTVHCKAYELSHKMPPVLRANLLPRLLLWADPFQDECPDLRDVGLYFFPDDNIAGSSETYALLFEVMNTQSSVMRIYFDGVDAVDLLIFTSKQLHLESLNTVTSPRTENFLWGIFRDKNHCRADMDDNGTTVDMEVDMVGGKMVGTVDVVVQKDSSSPCRRSDVVVSKDSSTPCKRPEPIMNAVAATFDY